MGRLGVNILAPRRVARSAAGLSCIAEAVGGIGLIVIRAKILVKHTLIG